MIIRKMKASDANAIAGLLAASPEAAQWTIRDVAQPAWPQTGVWVADADGQVIGFVAARTAGGEAEILNLAVAPARRRSGAGRLLVVAAEQAAEGEGAGRVYLEVRESNTGARAFYARLGFTECGRRRSYYNDPVEDALVLMRPLAGNRLRETHFDPAT